MATKRRSSRRTRKRKYSGSDEEEEDMKASGANLSDCFEYKISEKLQSETFDHPEMIERLDPKEFTIGYIKRTGLIRPLFFTAPPKDLGMKMPNPKTFGVKKVESLTGGGQRKIEVVEVKTQSSKTMRFCDFISYYRKPADKRGKLLNLLSLEFSLTELQKKVKAPEVLRSIDWVELYWPKELRKRHELALSGGAGRAKMAQPPPTYPKVQNYCLLSVADCYTDFHIDFGGTSVWYHVLKGEKIFWMVEPTEQNLTVYENWLLSGDNQNHTFFGDIVEKCARVRLPAGSTFVIPAGWIHGVYTVSDSLVFGGNFLHSHAIPMQLRIHQSENKTHVSTTQIKRKFRYPYFVAMLWYVAERVVRKATTRCYLAQLSSTFPSPADETSINVTAVNQLPSLLEQEENLQLSIGLLQSKSARLDSGAKTSDSVKSETVPVNDEDPIKSVVDDLVNATTNISQMSNSEVVCEDKDCPMEMKESSNEAISLADSDGGFCEATQFDDKYLGELSEVELQGLIALMNFLMRLNRKKREIGEGIVKPDHLLRDLQVSLSHAASLERKRVMTPEIDENRFNVDGEEGFMMPELSNHGDQDNESADDTGLNNNDNSTGEDVEDEAEGDTEWTEDKMETKTVKKTAKGKPKKKKQAKKSADPSTLLKAETLKTKKKKDIKESKKTDLAEAVSAQNVQQQPVSGHGFDPMASLVALGHKPLPTAFRKLPNMAAVSPLMRPDLPQKRPLESPLTGFNRSQMSPRPIVRSYVTKSPKDSHLKSSISTPSSRFSSPRIIYSTDSAKSVVATSQIASTSANMTMTTKSGAGYVLPTSSYSSPAVFSSSSSNNSSLSSSQQRFQSDKMAQIGNNGQMEQFGPQNTADVMRQQQRVFVTLASIPVISRSPDDAARIGAFHQANQPIMSSARASTHYQPKTTSLVQPKDMSAESKTLLNQRRLAAATEQFAMPSPKLIHLPQLASNRPNYDHYYETDARQVFGGGVASKMAAVENKVAVEKDRDVVDQLEELTKTLTGQEEPQKQEEEEEEECVVVVAEPGSESMTSLLDELSELTDVLNSQ